MATDEAARPAWQVAATLSNAQKDMLRHPIDTTLGGTNVVASYPRRTFTALRRRGIIDVQGGITKHGEAVRSWLK
jgi:hypothetical protein